MGRRRWRRTRVVVRRVRRRPQLRRRFTRGVLFGGLLGATVIVVGCLTSQQQGGITPVAPTTAPTKPKAFDRLIRVRLFGTKPVDAVEIEVSSGYSLADGRTGRVLTPTAAALPASRVAPAPHSPAAILFGGVRVDADDILVTPQRDGAIGVEGRHYRGSLRIRRVGDNLTVTNVLDLESYLRGVLRGELPASFHPQAQRALAVAARSYAVYEKLTSPANAEYDVLADERSQMYIGVKGEDAQASQAVDDTRGLVCLVRTDKADKSFSAYYSSCCGGRTQSVRDFRPSDPLVAPLAGGVACGFCADSPVYRWGPLKVSKTDITRRVFARYPQLTRIGQIMQISAESAGPDGRVNRVRLFGSSGASETLVGEDFRLCIGGHVMRSTLCKIIDKGKFVEFRDGRGFGHGVGLCQYGANGMARAGHNHDEIIRFYYPNCTLRRLY